MVLRTTAQNSETARERGARGYRIRTAFRRAARGGTAGEVNTQVNTAKKFTKSMPICISHTSQKLSHMHTALIATLKSEPTHGSGASPAACRDSRE